MGSFGSGRGNVVYLVVCAAPPALRTAELLRQLQAVGWDACVILTPTAAEWVDAEELTEISGHRARSEFRGPDDPKFSPLGDTVLVAPASFNTINKTAAGISDNLALGLLNEAIGRRVPVTIVPWVNDALGGHPAFAESLARLEAAGVQMGAVGSDTDPVSETAKVLGVPTAANTGPTQSDPLENNQPFPR